MVANMLLTGPQENYGCGRMAAYQHGQYRAATQARQRVETSVSCPAIVTTAIQRSRRPSAKAVFRCSSQRTGSELVNRRDGVLEGALERGRSQTSAGIKQDGSAANQEGRQLIPAPSLWKNGNNF